MPGETALAFAVRRRWPEVVEVLLAKGADLHAKDKKGRTPLSSAKETGDQQIVELLQKYGAKE